MSAERAAPGLFAATARLFALEWPSLLRGRRGRWMLPLLAWPVLMPLLHLAAGGRLPWAYCLGAYLDWLLPLVALFYAARLVGHHVEQGTIVYVLARPVPRAAILLGAFTAYLAATAAVAVPALGLGFLLCAHDGGGSFETLARGLGAALAALSAFGALFAFLGLVLRKPLVFGLITLFSSVTLAGAGGLFPRVTLTAPLRVRAGGPDAPTMISLEGAALGLAALTLLALMAAVLVFRAGEYVPER